MRTDSKGTRMEVDSIVQHLCADIITVMVHQEYCQAMGISVAGRLMAVLAARIYLSGLGEQTTKQIMEQHIMMTHMPTVRDILEKIILVARQTTEDGLDARN